MSSANQALVVNAIPLLALAALLGLAAFATARGPAGRRDLALLLACASLGAAILGVAVLVDEEPLAGHAWLSLAAILLASVPALTLLARRRPTAARDRPRELRPDGDRGRPHAAGELATALAHAEDPVRIARILQDATFARVDVDFVGLAVVDGSEARGVEGRTRKGEELALFAEVRFDLETEPSAIASTVFEAAPIVVHDMTTSPIVHRGLTTRIGAKSGVFVPLVAHEQVIGVLAAVTTRAIRAFTGDELTEVGELAAQAAPALERVRSASALASAREREQLVAALAHRVRSELDSEAVLRTAVAEAGAAARCTRCLVRLGRADEAGPVLAEWRAAGVPAEDEAARPEPVVLETPIVVFDREVGVLALHRFEPAVWSPDESALAEAVAGELGILIHTHRLVHENARRLEQGAALLKAAQSVTSELEPHAVLQSLVHEVAGLLGGDAADCYLLDQERGVLRCAAVHGLAATLVGYEFPADRGLSGEALVRGRPVIASDYEHVAEPVPNTAYGDFVHAIVAPVIWSGQPLGVLGVGSRAEGTGFDNADADMLEWFASLASLALRNAEVFEERSRQARVQRGFFRIASVLGEPLSLAATLDAVALAASEALGGAFAAVLMRRGERLELAGGQGLPKPLVAAFAEGLPAEETALHAAAAEGRILAARSVAEDGRFEPAWKGLAGRIGYEALLAIPVHGEQAQQESGLVLIFFRDERSFTDDDLELARHLGGAARGALERASRFEEERRARALAQQLARTGTLLATELDPAAVLEEVVQQAPELLDVDAAAMRVLEGEELVVTAVAGEGTEEIVGQRSPATGWLSGDVVQSRAPLAIEDAAGDDRLRTADVLLTLGYRSFLGVPLSGPDAGRQGVLAVYGRRPKAWSVEEIEALRALAGNASAALANAELYQRVALQKEQADAILSNIADGIVAVDRDGKVVLWNNAAEQITGVPQAEALERTPQEVLGRDLESLAGARGNLLVSILRGGDEVWLSLTEAIMRDPAGAVAGRIYAFRDISSEHMVEQMKSDFVSTVSQELRRPLTSIYGFAETLLRRDVAFGDEERRVFLGYIASESGRLTEIVDRLLNVARLDTGDVRVDVVPTDVAAVASEVVAGVEATVAEEHRLVLDVPPEPLHAGADPERLRQVIGHLIENAVKFSPDGGTVTVAARQHNGAAELSVTDEGVGILPGERERIFRKFYRGDTGGRGGTGLGLFIVQGLVEAMGGTISVDSTEGEGSSFSIELPLAEPVAEPLAELVRESGAGRV